MQCICENYIPMLLLLGCSYCLSKQHQPTTNKVSPPLCSFFFTSCRNKMIDCP
jgi:hypothetical protein